MLICILYMVQLRRCDARQILGNRSRGIGIVAQITGGS